MFNSRSFIPELMDQPELPVKEINGALWDLAKLNYFSRIASSFWPAIRSRAEQAGKPIRILDIATGAGDLPAALNKKANSVGIELQIDGCDLNPHMLKYAQEQARRIGAKGNFFQLDVVRETIPSGYDVYLSALFTHHLSSDDVVLFLQNLVEIGPELVLINDLRRSIPGYLLAWTATRLLCNSKVVQTDGPISVRNAFTTKEFLAHSSQAGMLNAKIKNSWPCRFSLEWGAQ